MDNNILELDDKTLFIKFAYFSFTKVEVFFRVWLYGTSDLKRKRFRVFSRFLNFFFDFLWTKRWTDGRLLAKSIEDQSVSQKCD